MITQHKKNAIISETSKLILALALIIVLLLIDTFLFLHVLSLMSKWGTAVLNTQNTFFAHITLLTPSMSFMVFSLIVILVCIGTIYDVISRPKKLKEIIQVLKSNEKISIRIKMISKRNGKKDSDLLQAYIVKWEFINKKVPHIKTETIFYTDEPDFMFKYRNQEASIEYDDKYFDKYKLNLM